MIAAAADIIMSMRKNVGAAVNTIMSMGRNVRAAMSIVTLMERGMCITSVHMREMNPSSTSLF